MVNLGEICRELVLIDDCLNDTLLPGEQLDKTDLLHDISLQPGRVKYWMIHLLEYISSKNPQLLPSWLKGIMALSRDQPQLSLKASRTTCLPSKVLGLSRL